MGSFVLRNSFVIFIKFLFGLQLFQVIIQSIEALIPKPTILLDPIRCAFERGRVQATWPPLRWRPR